MTLRYISALLLAALLLFFWAIAGDRSGNEELELSRKLIAIRMIGHDILLQAGDSTSRVMPVKQLAANEYRLQFENPFSFEPDSLVTIVHRIATAHHLPADYIVNVLNCTDNEIIYGYAMSMAEQNKIVPCSGRKQRKSCYYITIQFPGSGRAIFKKSCLIAVATLLAITLSGWGWQWRKKRRSAAADPRKQPQEDPPLKDPPLPIGKTLFYRGGQYLSFNEEKTMLTTKECALLSIFALSPNNVIDRSRLQKEIWEDEGVIVGRSLDMFVSKLRKKLEADASVRIVNIHGKGYKLEVS